jgi:alpha-tubulin suppressor-like RCC1 family protein
LWILADGAQENIMRWAFALVVPFVALGLSSTASAREIAAGQTHTCAITNAGGVKCWGANNYGQLGDGTTKNRLIAGDVSGLTSGVLALAAGRFHTCALTTAGGLKCWGRNTEGELGDGTITNRFTPVDVSGLATGVTQITAGSFHSCARIGGAAKCWGQNVYGQLGNGTRVNSSTPVDVNGLAAGVQTIAAGAGHTCALKGIRTKCWGFNGDGELGDGTTVNKLAPVNAKGKMTAVAGGDRHTCAVADTGRAKCWGWNAYGQLGDGSITSRLTPVRVIALRPAQNNDDVLTGGGGHTCALTDTGAVRCWGQNIYGQLGDGTTASRSTPRATKAGPAVAIAAGVAHTCALKSTGKVRCWGRNLNGQLGDGTTANRATPVNVKGF